MCMQAERFPRNEHKRIAYVAAGFYRAAVIHHSPGLQPWVSCIKSHALKVASEVARLALGVDSVDGARSWHDGLNQYAEAQNTPVSRHFQGARSKSRNPGLKPWAVLFSPFRGPSVGADGYDSGLAHYSNTPTLRLEYEDEQEHDEKVRP